MRKIWEEDELNFIKVCRENSWTCTEIANELNRTAGAIQQKSIRTKISSTYSSKLTNNDFDKKLVNTTIKRIDTYNGNKVKINFECLKCNHRWLSTPNNIDKGNGCPKCADTTFTNEIIDKKLKNRPIKRLGKYINYTTKIEFKCTKCNNIWKTGFDVIHKGSGCPNCANTGFNNKIPAVTYCIYFLEYDLYKIGISNNIVERLKQFGSKPEVIFLREFKLGTEARELETIWLENIKDYKINTGMLLSGNTETFNYGDI